MCKYCVMARTSMTALCFCVCPFWSRILSAVAWVPACQVVKALLCLTDLCHTVYWKYWSLFLITELLNNSENVFILKKNPKTKPFVFMRFQSTGVASSDQITIHRWLEALILATVTGVWPMLVLIIKPESLLLGKLRDDAVLTLRYRWYHFDYKSELTIFRREFLLACILLKASNKN